METVIRVFLIYVLLVIGLRIVGKREFSQLSPLELVTLLIIPEIVSHALIREDYSLTNAMVGTSTLLVTVYLSSMLEHYFKGADRVLNSSPTVLVRHGEFLTKPMNEERIAPGEVFDALHQSGLARLDDVQWAILEADGKITVIPKEAPRFSQRQAGKETEMVG